jgi:hypothetical protein
MLSKRDSGSLMEMVLLEGFKFGKDAALAFDQSRYSVESVFAQNSPAVSSESRSGTCLSLFKIDLPLFFIHVTGGHDPNSISPSRKDKKQQPPSICGAERIMSRFVLGVFLVWQYIQGMVEKHLFAFPPSHPVTKPIFIPVGIVPIETREVGG